jgi:hypothetical protein
MRTSITSRSPLGVVEPIKAEARRRPDKEDCWVWVGPAMHKEIPVAEAAAWERVAQAVT